MKKLFQPIDNAPLIIFRIFFGFLLAAETFGAILTGWVYRNFIEPKYYYRPIPQQQVVLNPNLKQIFGW